LCEQGLYFYADRNFSILDQPLSESDLETLRAAASLLSQFKGLPVAEGLVAVLQRMDSWHGQSESAVIQFEANDQTSGIEWLKPLYESITQKQALQMEYLPFVAQEALNFVFHPYHLREFRNRWFVFGWNESSKAIYNLALDRIVHFSISNHPYIPNDQFDPSKYFKDIIGVTRIADAEPIEIRFRTTPLQARYLQTKPIHSSQSFIESTEQGVVFSIYVIPNYELYAELLRMGSALEVLSPEEIKLVVHTN
jgi:predicted DNA-binding transcriptional regulator YafY